MSSNILGICAVLMVYHALLDDVKVRRRDEDFNCM